MAIVRAQEASSSTSLCSYHVFLSFSEDTRKTFTDHLYTALTHAGFRTYRDDDEIERGENIKFELEKAIQESRISIIVLSKNYATSSWCLDELVMILERLRTSRHEVLPVFYNVDPSHVRKQTGNFEETLTKHEETLEIGTGETKKEWKGKVEEWRAALKEVADLAGMNLQNQADGHESKFIQKIVNVVADKLDRVILAITPHLIGIHFRAKNIQLWLRDGSTDVSIIAICGMGGIGKTTIAKILYNSNFSRFEGSSFLANVREISRQPDGLVRLQGQLLSDVSKRRKEIISNVYEGITKIKEALCCKRLLVVLDDVDKLEQLDAVLGMADWLFPGSKIIITTRHEDILRARQISKVHRVENFDDDESLELFSWHAFGQNHPINDFVEESKKVVYYCGGLPLAIKVLGSSLCRRSLNVWKSQLEKLKAIPDNQILEILKISYDSLQDDHDKNLFLYIACFFVGKDKDYTVTILDECDFYTVVGIQNLIERCLLTIDEHNKLEMHQLLQGMGRGVVDQKSPKEPGERTLLWNSKDSFTVLSEKMGIRKIEGLILDMHLSKDDKSSKIDLGVNRKRGFEEFLDKSLLSNVGNSLKRYRFGILSGHPVGNPPETSNQVYLEANAFARMPQLKLLQLSNVQISGSYENFPKGLRWLCWHGFHLQSIPSEFPFERLVALEMPYSNLNIVWVGTQCLELLKILNLSHSRSLVKTPNFLMLPNLERLILEDCASLIEVHESIGCLQRLCLLNLRDCKNLRRLPRSIGMLVCLKTLDISGCSNLEKLATELQNMESLTTLHASGTDINRLLFKNGDQIEAWHSLISWPWQLKPRKNPKISWASLPLSLVSLSLTHCNLSEDAFPEDLSNLSSLRELNLSHNPICSLPDCIRGFIGLNILSLESCTRLCSLIGLQNLEKLNVGGCTRLERLTFQSPPFCPGNTVFTSYGNPIELMSCFKLEPIGDVNEEIINKLGLSSLGSLGKPIVKLVSRFLRSPRKLPLQGCHEPHIFYAYLPGSKVPAWFNLKNTGSSISFTVPSSHDDDLNFRIQGLSICFVYALSNINATSSNSPDKYNWDVHIIVCNSTKSLKWSHCPLVFGLRVEADDDDEDMMMMLSYWKFKNQLEGSDELNISVVTGQLYQVKEVGVHLVLYEEEQEQEEKKKKKKKSSAQSSSTSEEEEEVQAAAVQQHQIYPYGNVVPGNASEHPARIKVYQLGAHRPFCKDCPDGDLIYHSRGELRNSATNPPCFREY